MNYLEIYLEKALMNKQFVIGIATMLFLLLLSLSSPALAAMKSLQDYVPVLPETLAKRLSVDPKKGYLVKKIKPNVYLMTDGIWQSVFITTGKGVILIDVPQSYGAHIQTAVAAITKEPIKTIVYTHAHIDHIGGSIHFKDLKNLKIISSHSVANYLAEKQDLRRLVPTATFRNDYVINMGSAKIELKNQGNYHSNEGDLYVYLTHQKVLIVIDSMAPGYVPFMSLDLSSNVHEYLNMFSTILDYDFDAFIGGHLSHIGTRDDVIATHAYVNDVYQTVKRIHQKVDQLAIMSTAAKEIGWDNKYLLFKTFLNTIIQQCAREIESRWINKLSGVDVWSESHCQAMLIYVRWDD